MLKEGQLVYYLVGSRVDQGHVIDIEQKANGTGFTFRIDSFGGCEGQYVIDSSEIGLSVFLTEEIVLVKKAGIIFLFNLFQYQKTVYNKKAF